MSPKPKEPTVLVAAPHAAYQINGLVGRLRAISEVSNSLVIAPAVLVYAFCVLSGFVSFRPLDGISSDIKAHDTATAQAVTARAELDRKMVENLTRLTDAVERMERRLRISECSAIGDRDLRLRCLDIPMPSQR